MHIDRAARKDITELNHLLDALFTIEQDFRPDHDKQQRGLELLVQNDSTACILVARDDWGKPIGMVTAQLVISTAEGAASAWIEDLVVVAGQRRRGVGRSLLRAILDWAKRRGATRAQLLCDLDNATAVAFYDGKGWSQTRLTARRYNLSR